MISIYVVANQVNGKRYVGQSKDATKRFATHKKNARRNVDGALYSAIRKYGADKFVMRVIESCPTRDRANEMERRWISLCSSRTHEHGYNLTAGGDGGSDPSAETRAKIGAAARNRSAESLAKMRRPRSEEAVASMRASRKPHSAATLEKLRLAHLGKRASQEARAKMSAAHKGRVVTEETRNRLSIAAKRVTENIKRNLHTTESNRSRVWDDAARARMSAAKKNISEATRKKMSVAQSLRWSKERV